MRFKRRRAPQIPEPPERPRSIILGRTLADDPKEGDPSAFDEFLIEALSNLPASRIRSIFAEAIGRAQLAVELAIIELDPGGGGDDG
jgi:hypothetical protein